MKPYEDLARAAARVSGLDEALVCAVIEQESGWDTTAIRYEPAFYDRYIVPLKIRNATEAMSRAFSFGLMQCMGQVARENGFQGKFLTELCQPETGINVGVKVLSRKLSGRNGDVHAGLQAWNGGGNLSYADEVMARMRKYQP